MLVFAMVDIHGVLEEWAQGFGLPVPSEQQWYHFQGGHGGQKGWCQAVLEVAEEKMALIRVEIIDWDGDKGTVVNLDARFDSSRDGYHGTVPVLDLESGKMLHVVTLTRVETGSSWKTEDVGVRQAVEDLLEAGVKIQC